VSATCAPESCALANAGPEAKLSLDGARLVVMDGEASRTIDLSTLAADEAGIVLAGEGEYDPPTTAWMPRGQGVPYATYGFAARRSRRSVDAARHGEGQAHHGGARRRPRHQPDARPRARSRAASPRGIGLALMEEYLPGRTENLHDYLIPTTGDMPEIAIRILIEVPDPEGPFGAKGVGEHGLIATAPAILNAIRHATGAQVTAAPRRSRTASWPPSDHHGA
jgi:aldehyde oxidoreductase